MTLFFRQLQHLMPRAQAWRTTADKALRRLLLGLAGAASDAVAFANDCYLDLYPNTTRELTEWERQFGLTAVGTEADRRVALAAAWAASGGQSRLYIEETLHAAGFAGVNVFESRGISPADVGAPYLWYRGDDPDATISAGQYIAIPNLGTVAASTIDYVAPTVTSAVAVAGKLAPDHSAGGVLSAYYAGADIEADLAYWHQPGYDATFCAVVDLDTADTACVIWQTTNPAAVATNTGVVLSRNADNTVRARLYAAGALTLDISSAATISTGLHVVALRRTESGEFDVVVDGVQDVSGTPTALSTRDFATLVRFGGSAGGATPIPGRMPEVAIYRERLSDLALAHVRAYLRRWSSASELHTARDPHLWTTEPLMGQSHCAAYLEPAQVTCSGYTIAGLPEAAQVSCDGTLYNSPGYIVNLDLTNRAIPRIPDDQDTWPFFVYFAGATIAERGYVPLERRAEFERLILRICPAEQWLVTYVDYYEIAPAGIALDGYGIVVADPGGEVLVYE